MHGNMQLREAVEAAAALRSQLTDAQHADTRLSGQVAETCAC